MSTLDDLDVSHEDFVWKDGERLIAFGPSALASLPAYLHAKRMEEYVLLTTERALRDVPDVAAGATQTITVGDGPVADVAMSAIDQVGAMPIVVVGGGRVIDAAKGIAGANGQKVAAIPTTLSGAPMTETHRLPKGYDGKVVPVRPAIVIGVPDLMASQPENLRTGSAMNALAHAVESAFVTTGSAIPRLASARAAELLFRSLLDHELSEKTRRARLALGGLEAGYAVGATGYAIHHVICQTIVAIAGVPHAPTYGVMLPFTLEFYKVRDDLTWTLIAEAMGTDDPSLMIAKVCASSGNPTTLTDLGVAPERIDSIIAAASERPQLKLTPGGATTEDIRSLIESAL